MTTKRQRGQKTKKVAQQRQRHYKTIAELRPIDDIFARCMFKKGGKELVQAILRIILDNPELSLKEVNVQADAKRLEGARSAIMDVLAVDTDGTRYDLEIERSNDSVLRLRYYRSLMDIEALNAGQDFDELPETYVIFVTEKDKFGEGAPIYDFSMRRNRPPWTQLGDKQNLLLFNASYKGDDILGQLAHDFRCSKASEMYIKEMRETASSLKETKKGEIEMCKALEDLIQEHVSEAVTKAQKEAVEGTEQTARYLLSEACMSAEMVATATRLPLERILELQAALHLQPV